MTVVITLRSWQTPALIAFLGFSCSAHSMVAAQQRHRVRGCDNQSPHHLCDELYDYACVCMCLNDMFCISPPPEGSFSARYTITLTGVLICKQRQDKCMCHSPPHGIPSSHTRGQEVRNRVMTVNCTIQVKWQRGLWKPLKALAL